MAAEVKVPRAVNRSFLAMAIPPALFLAWGLFLPLMSIFVFSVWRTDNYTLIPDFTLANYQEVVTGPYLVFVWRSLLAAFSTCFISLLLTWPAAYFIAKHGGRFRTLLTLAIAAPFFTGLVLRLVAFQALFGPAGMLSMAMTHLGLPSPDFMMFNRNATVLGLVYLYAPFMLVPIYLSLINFDFNLVEAAKVNGASPLRAFFEVTWPLNWAGTVIGFLIVFVPSLADAITTKFLGGPSGTSLGNSLSTHFGATGTWSLGAALGVVLFTLSMIVVLLLMRSIDLRKSGISVWERVQ
jgi:ABC-type spermidine/putrescine transport system permease subunit I